MITVFPCYAAADKTFARELAAFLECGADVQVFLDDGEIGADENLVSKAVDGMQADVILLILSPDSRPAKWVRSEWEPAMRDEPREAGVKVGTVLLRPCEFPALLRREAFFDLSQDRRGRLSYIGFREIKRWLRPIGQPGFEPLRQPRFQGREAELEQLCRTLADAPGAIALTGKPASGKTTLALEFARETQLDFDGTVWVHCGGESLAAICGEWGSQLGIALTGEAESNLAEILSHCSRRRLLVVLDDAPPEGARLIAAGRSSTLLIARLAPAGCASMALGPLPEQPRQPHLPALNPCGRSPFRLWLAAGESDSVIQLNSRLFALAGGALQQPSEAQSRAHAHALALHFAHWSQPESECAADLPQLRRALQWALSQDEEDAEAWELACQLVRRGTALLKQLGRQAEAFELLDAVASAAIPRDDRRMLEDCSRDQVWILESWDRWKEAESLHFEREAIYSNQTRFKFE